MMASEFANELLKALGIKNCLSLTIACRPGSVDMVIAEVWVPGELKSVVHQFDLYAERKPQPAEPKS